MKTIWKYELFPTTKLELPIGSKLLKVNTQKNGAGEKPMLWFLLDPNMVVTETKTFTIYGTGHNVPDHPGEYVGTFFLLNDSLVFHVFES